MRALVTGASGFAGAWLCRECAAGGDEVLGVSRSGGAVAAGPAGAGRVTAASPDAAASGEAAAAGEAGWRASSLDLLDRDAVAACVARFAPEVVYHLAALSSVGRSWEDPAQTLEGNVGAAVNLLEAVRMRAPAAHVIWVSTCEVYGPPAQLPTTEDAPIAPANPYAVSKAAGEMLAGVYARAHGLRVTCARPYSHSGPGQRPIFLLSNLARQGAEGRLAGVASLRIATGNPDTRRDFTDVRDVARAYRRLAALDPPPGRMEVFNVCTGVSISAREQVRTLAELLAPIAVEHVVDPARVRASEVMELCGDNRRLTAVTGWRPTIPFAQTMADTIAWWERALTAQR